jgi:hypothetical protein
MLALVAVFIATVALYAIARHLERTSGEAVVLHACAILLNELAHGPLPLADVARRRRIWNRVRLLGSQFESIAVIHELAGILSAAGAIELAEGRLELTHYGARLNLVGLPQGFLAKAAPRSRRRSFA